MKKPVTGTGKNVVIVGSGVGGLSTGIILAQLKYDVTVVEKNPLPGGLMRSYRRSGIDCPVGVHYVGALGENEPLGKIFRLMGISVAELFEPMGKEGVIDHYIFDDFVFDLPIGIDNYEKNLRAAFPQDTVAIDLIMKNLREIARQMLDPSFIINQGDPFQNIDHFSPMGEYLTKINASPGLQAVMAVPSTLIGVHLADCPVIFHHMVLAGYLFSCWRLKESGGKMADVFAQRFTELGGKLILNDAAEKILTEGGRVSGLQLKSGKKLPADVVVAAIHPKVLLELLEPDSLRVSYRERILGLTETEGIIAIQVRVDARLHPQMSHNIYRLHKDENGLMCDGVFYQLRHGNENGFNLLTIITRSLYGEWKQWEKTQTGRRGKEYEEKKLSMANDLLNKAGEIFGDLGDAKILDVFTPLTLRDYVDCPEGSCYGLLRSSNQLLKLASLNNVPLPGLCLAGQNAVAPGVLGSIMGSFGAVRKIIGQERFIREIKWPA